MWKRSSNDTTPRRRKIESSTQPTIFWPAEKKRAHLLLNKTACFSRGFKCFRWHKCINLHLVNGSRLQSVPFKYEERFRKLFRPYMPVPPYTVTMSFCVSFRNIILSYSSTVTVEYCFSCDSLPNL